MRRRARGEHRRAASKRAVAWRSCAGHVGAHLRQVTQQIARVLVVLVALRSRALGLTRDRLLALLLGGGRHRLRLGVRRLELLLGLAQRLRDGVGVDTRERTHSLSAEA